MARQPVPEKSKTPDKGRPPDRARPQTRATPPITSDGKPSVRGLTSGLWSYPGLAIVIGTAGLIAAMLLVYLQLVYAANARHAETLATTRASLLAGALDVRLTGLEREMTAIASAPGTVAALSSLDPTTLDAEGARLTALHPYADRIEIIPRGRAEVDLSSATPISFAALDVIKRAETQPFVGPEAAQLGQRTVFYVAKPITQQGAVAGVLFAALSADYFAEPLASFDPSTGRLAVEQRFANAPATTILEKGDAGSGEAIGVALKAENWRLLLVPNPASTPDNVNPLALAAPFGVALALLLAGVYLSYSRLFRKLESDGAMLLDYVARAVRGRGGNVDRYQLPLFQQIAISAANVTRTGPAEMAGTPKRDVPKKETVREAVSRKSSAVTAGDADGDDDFLEIQRGDDPSQHNFGIEVSEEVSPVDLGLELDPSVFRAYDIRGIVGKNLSEDVVYWIGRAFAAEAQERKNERVVVGCDGRLSSDALKSALNRGLNEGGVDVMDIGLVPTPLAYYATYALETGTCIMITGSHNPPEYNGLKLMLAGETLAEGRIQRLKERIELNEFSEGTGSIERVDIVDHYIDRVVDDVAIALPLKVVVDCGNGVAGSVAPRLLAELGCEVVPLYCDVDGTFPNHHPDPADPKNMEDLITVVRAEKADLGLAFDGDGDRLGVVTNTGEIVWPDKLLMLFSRDIVGRNPGADIIFDVKCSRHLNALISEYGGRPIMWKTGHSHIKAKLKETGALLAGEFSGHICFGERWYGFDDALYSAARLLEIVGGEARRASDLFSEFPVTFATPEIKIETSESAKFAIVEKLARDGAFGEGTITTIDGVRVDYPDGWGLVRASNTSPVLTLRFEADGQTALTRIQRIFASQLQRIDPKLTFSA